MFGKPKNPPESPNSPPKYLQEKGIFEGFSSIKVHLVKDI